MAAMKLSENNGSRSQLTEAAAATTKAFADSRNSAKSTINCNTGHAVEASLRKQLSLLAVIRCLRTAQLAPPPIVVPYYQAECKLDASSILWLGSWYSALAAICEMPSGLISDVLGRKLTLQLAFLGLGACWIVTYASSQTVSSTSSSAVIGLLGLSQVFRAIGSSLYSGTDMALLYELLKEHRKQQKKDGIETKAVSSNDLALKLESRQVVLSTITEAVVAALGGLLSRSYGASATVLTSALPFMVGAVICGGLKETSTGIEDGTPSKDSVVSPTRNGDKQPSGASQSEASDPPAIPKKQRFVRERSSRIFIALNQPPLRVIFGVGVILNCATYVASTALNPLLWQQVGISNLAGGFLQASNSGMTALGALAAPTMKGYCSKVGHSDGTHGLLVLLLSASAAAYGLMTWNAFASIVPIDSPSLIHTVSTVGASWLLSLVRGLAWPVLGSALNASIGDNGCRATVLSLFAGAIKIGMVVTGFALGYLLRQSSSLGNACGLCGVLLVGAAACCLALFSGGRTPGTSLLGEEPSMLDGGAKKDQ